MPGGNQAPTHGATVLPAVAFLNWLRQQIGAGSEVELTAGARLSRHAARCDDRSAGNFWTVSAGATRCGAGDPRSGASGWSVKIRTTHEVVTARAAQLALLIVQFMAATGAPAPVFAGWIARGRGAAGTDGRGRRVTAVVRGHGTFLADDAADTSPQTRTGAPSAHLAHAQLTCPRLYFTAGGCFTARLTHQPARINTRPTSSA